MDWVLRSPQIHSTFSNLGFVQADGYHVNENCNSALESILHNILTEDKFLRTYRRSISFGQNIKKDIIPLLIHAKDDKTIELVIKILVNLTIPIECLLNLELISKSDFGRHTIFEINNLLTSTKVAFMEIRATKALVDFLKKNVETEHKKKLSEEQCTNVSNCLLLLRNILHIPEENCHLISNYNGSMHSVQNQILWNIFSQSIDKIIIKSMTIPDASYWGVTMVQLVALLYKDQHVVTLHKLLNMWLEASLSESSEDNESNTSPQDRGGSDDSSRMLTSDPTSDSSDTGGGSSGKGGDIFNSENTGWENGTQDSIQNDDNHQTFQHSEQDANTDDDKSTSFLFSDQVANIYDNKSATFPSNEPDPNVGDDKSSGFGTSAEEKNKSLNNEITSGMTAANYIDDQNKNQKQNVMKSETSDCGYGTQIENQESISTSSNEDDLPMKKPVHQKPHNTKQRPNLKPRINITVQDRKRKKIVKRGKANIINVHGLSHKTPTDDDISNVLKEFTVDFLLKGYNSLVHTLHNEILTNVQLQIDTSHFFWLVTYFLKFATQIELDLEHVCSVLSFDIVSYLTSEGVNLCEQFELAIKLDGSDLSPTIRRLHLVVTSIREFVQAIEVYKKITHLSEDDHKILRNLQIKMCETEELRSMLVLLLRHYSPKYHSKQYLQDLIVTNHILLMFLDNVMKFPDYNCSTKMIDHIRQFATPEVMAQYGLLLEDYLYNGEFVNDCVFTLMHHVGGEAGSLITLFQPSILKTFTAIWKSDFEICDDWSDLIEYVINTFVKKPTTLNDADLCLESGCSNYNKENANPIDMMSSHSKDVYDDTIKSMKCNAAINKTERWTEDEISSLSWNYLQCNTHGDIIGKITKQLSEDGIIKTRDSVIRELLRQNLISRDFYDRQLKGESERNTRTVQINKEKRDDEIRELCEHLIQDGKSDVLDWVQRVLLEISYAKIQMEKAKLEKEAPLEPESKLMNFEVFRPKSEELPIVSPVAYHALILKQSIPLVPWNCQQASACRDLKFLQLLHKLGFHMPVDTGKLFIRIPHFWTADCLFSVAGRIRPIDLSKLKFSVCDLPDSDLNKTELLESSIPAAGFMKESLVEESSENFYQVHRQRLATMVNFTPMPGPSYSSGADLQPHTWLQVVQKSQECKITLNLESITETREDIVMELLEESGTMPMPAVERVETSARIETLVKQETSICNVHLNDPEFYNSCETASVASDLTRMYVSDEDEKLDSIVRPKIDLSTITEEPSRKPKISGKRRRQNV